MKTKEFFLRTAYALKNDYRFKYYDKISKNLTISKDELKNIQLENLKRILKHAYESSVYYKNIFQNYSLNYKKIKDIDEITKIPILTKSDIKKNFNTIISKDSFGKSITINTSGGSTGNQAIFGVSKYSNEMNRAFFMRNNTLTRWQPSDKSAWIWGSPIEHSKMNQSLICKIGMKANNRILFNAYKFNKHDFYIWAKKINRFKPKVLYGYATTILEFSHYLLENDIEIKHINSVVTTTEKLEKREVIEKAFNCNVFNQYGCREIYSIATEYKPGSMLLSDDSVVLTTDQNSNFLITPLFSYGFPLINYKLGDCGVISKTNNNSNIFPFTAVKLTIGRTTDNFINYKNQKISTSAMGTYFSSFKIDIHEQQIIQTDYKNFIVNFVPGIKFSIDDYKIAINRVLSEYFGENLNIKFNPCTNIKKEQSGKKLPYKRLFKMEV